MLKRLQRYEKYPKDEASAWKILKKIKAATQMGSGLNYLLFGERLFGQFLKEVMLKNNTNPHQQTCIQTLALENVINICALTRDLHGQPSRRLPLLPENLFNVLTYIHIVQPLLGS
ncbi:MAG: hypothetical protein K2K03_08420 [Prevotella sp.]|nr:hypothetical protein [Prevotella sp.]